jgi:hypothetical protein|mmetsp:Transcript_67794/g.113592  ORF Transcript_67794/g.113592 Transcript_67794/m.113592 type:complete len:85 (+) Transcript_67794:66-320(+)|eukprot:CAMPEP_0174295644 /NCGR_PEP_ID=MMETSP0809-20121228/45443_1 /TAXON_ID=73025 ORGANISM="Eutreptiella gymnastica-like, Strain CCMP1594" /NCGR_SAMPLE_ID=MMETSP0809 /ASSEMBLY_ACC=CAM_ASM_000658 /LENGTH=84 /DNA_ID=CAMNT_0015398097 /DNA_START=34 /DNA_END=288 /DNA_ORIENTATION=+
MPFGLSATKSCEIESKNECYEGVGFGMDEDTCEDSSGGNYTFGADGDYSSWRSCEKRGYPNNAGNVSLVDVQGGGSKTFTKYTK